MCSILLLAAAGAAQAQAQSGQAAPAEEPSTLILSDTLHYDDIKRQSIFTGNVILTRGLMTLTSDKLEVNEDAAGNQFGVATADKGKIVTIRQDRPETFELIEGKGLRAEYESSKSQFDLIGQAIVTRHICGKPFDTIRGDRVRYNEDRHLPGAGRPELIGRRRARTLAGRAARQGRRRDRGMPRQEASAKKPQ